MKKKNFWWFALTAAIITWIAVGFFSDKSRDTPRQTQTQNTATNTIAVKPVPVKSTDNTRDYLNGRNQPVWLVTAAEIEKPEFAKLESIAAHNIVRIELALAKNQNNPHVKLLKEKFSKNLSASYYTRKYGGTSFLRSSRNEKELRDRLNKLEVCFYPAEYKDDQRMQGTTIHYDSEWKSLILPAMDIGDPWFAGIILHEMYHAYAHQSNLASATAPHLSDLWIEEELTAHDIERDVLVRATKGEYLKFISAIVKKASGVRDPDLLTAYVTTADLKEIDKIFPPADAVIANLRAAQYYFDITSVWLEKRFSGDELKKQRIAYYRSLSS